MTTKQIVMELIEGQGSEDLCSECLSFLADLAWGEVKATVGLTRACKCGGTSIVCEAEPVHVVTIIQVLRASAEPRGPGHKADPRENPDDAFEAFMKMDDVAWGFLLKSMATPGATLTPAEQSGFISAKIARARREQEQDDNRDEGIWCREDVK